MKTKYLLLTLLLLLTFSLSSCKKDEKILDIYLYDSDDTFIKSLADTIKDQFYREYNVRIYNSKKSQIIQNGQIINSLEAKTKPTYLLVNPVDRLSCRSIVEKAHKYKLPVIFFNREPILMDIEEVENAYYVGTNPEFEGNSQGKMAIDLLERHPEIDKNKDGKLQCVFIRGEQSHQDAEKRTYSTINYLQEHGVTLDILGMDYANWNRKEGYNLMKRYNTLYEDEIEFVFSNNDDMALGAVDYLKEYLEIRSREESISPIDEKAYKLPFPIVGVDGTQEGLEAIKDGYIYGTIVNDTLKQAQAITGLIKLIKGELTSTNFEKDYGIKLVHNNAIYVIGKIVTIENIEE